MSKRTILPFVILMILVNLVNAQTTRKGDLLIGVSLGPNFSNLRGSLDRSQEVEQAYGPIGYGDDLLKDIRYGISAGLSFEYFLKEDLSFKAALRYQNKGLDMSTEGSVSWDYIDYSTNQTETVVRAESFDRKVRNNYLVLPLLLRKYCFQSKNFFFEAGGYTSFLVKSDIDISQKIAQKESKPFTGGLEPVLGENQDSPVAVYGMEFNGIDGTDNTNEWDYGLSFGAGYIKNLNDRFRLELGLLCHYGLRKIDSQNDNKVVYLPASTGMPTLMVQDYYGLNSNSKNISLALNVGISYRIGK